MKKILLIFKNELVYTIFRKSFLSTLLILPLISILFMLLIFTNEGGKTWHFINKLFSSDQENVREGFVDPANLIQKIPEDLSDDLYEFSDEQKAQVALQDGFISTYYVIDPDYIKNGKITAVRTDSNPLGGGLTSSRIQRAITYNLLQGNTSLLNRFYHIVDLEAMILSETPADSTTSPPSLETQRDPDQAATYSIPFIVGYLFYMIIMGSSSLLFSSLNKERNNRTLEILLTSITPLQMLLGKLMALGLIGFGQTILWGSLGWIFLSRPGGFFNFELISQLPAHLLLWGILFFILGYLFYAALFSGVGALLSYIREISQVTTILILPLLIPIFLFNTMIMRPNSPLAIFISFLPLTSPVGMMTRLASTIVPTWQILLSALILLITDILTLWGISKLFQPHILLADQEIKITHWIRKSIFRRKAL